MASAQVLPASATRKKEHLEAGKRRLEEFRKKKAADRAKKAASSGQLPPADAGINENQSVESEHVRVTESDGAGTSDGFGRSVNETADTNNKNDKAIESLQNNYFGSPYGPDSSPLLSSDHSNSFSTETVHTNAKDHEISRYNSLGSDGPINSYYSPQTREQNDGLGTYNVNSGRLTYGTAMDQSVMPQAVHEIDSYSDQISDNGMYEARRNNNDTQVKNSTFINPGTSHVHPEYSGSTLLQNKFGSTSPFASPLTSFPYEDIAEASPESEQKMQGALPPKGTMNSDMGERKLSGFSNYSPENSLTQWPSEPRTSGSNFDVRSASNHVASFAPMPESNSRRSRPSFLDSINVSRIPSVSNPRSEPQKDEPFSSTYLSVDAPSPSDLENSSIETERVEPFSKSGTPSISNSFEHSMYSSVSAGKGSDLYRNSINVNNIERKDDFSLRKQDEDFAALEQHIEDLTQEKFSLQRALEASRALAESLATENSALTDSYNQQGSIVNQLKADMEILQEDIRTQLVEIESLKMEYANVQLECNASDERAKLLASEVIGLEEKALRMRSSELKLERQLENSQAEVSSLKKKMSSLEKERQDLQSTIDALQEEKKLLQTKLRKASATGKLIDADKRFANKKDVSTSTEDLVNREDPDSTADPAILEMNSSAPLPESDASSFPLLPESRQFNFEISSLSIPPDQLRTIQNINTLVSELALEKKELMQALLAQSSEASKLKELNKDLSRKLEAQTQRLELLTAQSMVNENVAPLRQLDSRTIPDNVPYADEGDEVVERVLGWIMKLFPGGPSRRRTSKLL